MNTPSSLTTLDISYTLCHKKDATKLMAAILSNFNLLPKFFYYQCIISQHIDLGLLISIFLHHLSEKNAQICRKSAQWARGLHDVSNIQHSLSRHRICGWWTASITSTTSTGYGQSTSSARRLFAFVCLSLTKKWRISMCSNLVYGMILEYPRSLMVLGLKGQRS